MARVNSTGRLPFQNRNPNTISAGGLSTDRDYVSKDAIGSSGSENIKRVSMAGYNDNDRLNSSTHASTGAPAVNQIPRASTSSNGSNQRKPTLSRAESAPIPKPGDTGRHSSKMSLAASISSQKSRESDEPMEIEEKRRKLNGEGYTVHRYIRGRLLGRGGFAKVYHCTALDTNKHYAIKIVPKSNLVKPRAKQKLQAEIKIHRTLKHKNICEYKHFFEDKTNCYILLELCHNQSMNELIKRRKRLTEPEAAFYLKQLTIAVNYMHTDRVIHRDLKLGNLFLDKELNIKVGDLGLATRLSDLEEKRKTICGTPNYIAPEVIQGSKETRGHSFEVDVWSMGVILYTVLVGKPPYEAKDVKATYQRIIANEYSFPSHVQISEHSRNLITSMLQSKPHKRPTLDEIMDHEFLTNNYFKIPDSLPPTAVRVAPEWREDNDGNLYVVESTNAENASGHRSSKNKSSMSHSSSRRQPFSRKDPNADGADRYSEQSRPSKPSGERADCGPIVRTCSAVAVASAACGTGSSPAAFEIFDESNSKQKQQMSSGKNMLEEVEKMTARTGAMSMKDMRCDKESDTPTQSSPLSPSSGDQDMQIVRSILQNINFVMAKGDALMQNNQYDPKMRPAALGGAKFWVTRYVDYTSKYGLGFLLNDGSSGVYFNDSTKAVLESDGEMFQYIERRKTSSETGEGRRAEPTVETHTLSAFPDSLQKKVTLVKHFRNYLLEQQKRAEDEGAEDLVCLDEQCADPLAPLVYLKKWVRTKHAIVFRLSNHSIQIVFYDQTEILLTSDERFITYVDKQRQRTTYILDEGLIVASPEIAKRLKYSKDILQQFVGQKR